MKMWAKAILEGIGDVIDTSAPLYRPSYFKRKYQQLSVEQSISKNFGRVGSFCVISANKLDYDKTKR